ncbi:hypothetical protein ET445_03285 [Agromyces protaetiae]|uniref:Uncharacterized protein n=1 Tax=Agromyces protaetiae TaxID=2509455 RepID=A0A4P6FPS2_9MICO|nr:hypothetical protein [Agromyces protaetiae]QAY72508.1 hypothetical protein ET445_03285 [Agromyces protaetiae]
MQYAAAFVATHQHDHDVLRAERELALRRDAAERAELDDADAPAAKSGRRPFGRSHRRAHGLPKLALR